MSLVKTAKMCFVNIEEVMCPTEPYQIICQQTSMFDWKLQRRWFETQNTNNGFDDYLWCLLWMLWTVRRYRFFVAKLVNKKYPANVNTHICKDLRSVCTSDRYFIQQEGNRP